MTPSPSPLPSLSHDANAEHPPLIYHLLLSSHVLILYQIKTHPRIKYFVVHNIPLDNSPPSVSDEHKSATLNDSKNKSLFISPDTVPGKTGGIAISLPCVALYDNSILFYHISYFQQCLKQQDLFVTYVNGSLRALKEEILMRNQMNLMMIQRNLELVLQDYLCEKSGKGCGRIIDPSQQQEKWIHGTIEYALDRLDVASGTQQQLVPSSDSSSLVSLFSSQKSNDLSPVLKKVQKYEIVNKPDVSIKQLVLDHGMQHLTTNYSIDLHWPWKDLDLIVCVRNEKLFEEDSFNGNMSHHDHIKAVRQTRCIVMDHNSIIRSITHEYPVPFEFSRGNSKKKSSQSCQHTEKNLQSKLKKSVVVENVDGFVCTLFYEQGEWLMVSGESFRSKFKSTVTDPLFFSSSSSPNADPLVTSGAVQQRAKHLSPKEISDMFFGTFYENGYEFPEDTQCCYTFVLQLIEYPKNVHCKEDRLILVAVHKIESDTHFGEHQIITEKDFFQVGRKLNYETPKVLSFQDMRTIRDSLMDLNPLEKRGYVMLMSLETEDESKRITSNDALQFNKMYDRILLDSPQFTACRRIKHFHNLDGSAQLSVMYDLIRSGFDQQVLPHLKFREGTRARAKALKLHSDARKRVETAAEVIQPIFIGIEKKPKKEFSKLAQKYAFSNALIEMRRQSHTDFLTQFLKYNTITTQQVQNVLKKIEEYHEQISREHFDYLVVVDLEATCDEGVNPKITPKTQEIIEFPFVVMDLHRKPTEKEIQERNLDFNIMHRSQRFVKPEWSKNLTPFCTQLTGITWEKLESAPPLEIVISQVDQELREVIPPGKSFCFLCDGVWDIKQMLLREARAKDIDLPPYMRKFFNLKDEVHRSCPKKLTRSLKKMAAELGAEVYGHHHSGLDDSITIARIANALIVKKNHEFTHPITVPEDYNPDIDLTFASFKSNYISGVWNCWRCNEHNAATSYACGKCKARRLTAEQFKSREMMNRRIEQAFAIPTELAVSKESGKWIGTTNKNLRLFLRLLKSGLFGGTLLVVMRRLEPRRRRFWLFVSAVLAVISYICDWPKGLLG